MMMTVMIPTLNLDPGETITCEFTNERTPLLKIIKQTTVNSLDDDNYKFDFTITGDNNFNQKASVIVPKDTHMGMTALPYIPVPEGQLSVVEDDYTNWKLLLGSSCDIFEIDEGFESLYDETNPTIPNLDPNNIPIGTSDIAVCTFSNHQGEGDGYITGGGRVVPEPPLDDPLSDTHY